MRGETRRIIIRDLTLEMIKEPTQKRRISQHLLNSLRNNQKAPNNKMSLQVEKLITLMIKCTANVNAGNLSDHVQTR